MTRNNKTISPTPSADGQTPSAKKPRGRPLVRIEDLPDVLTVEEAADVLRLSRNGAYEAIQRNEIPHLRIGRRVLVPKQRLIDFVQRT